MSADPEVLHNLADAIEVRIALSDAARGEVFNREIEALGNILYVNSKEIIAALRAPQKDGAAASEWQPIETAPRDGTDVLIYVPENREQFVAFYSSGNWQHAYYSPDDVRIVSDGATHWQPLPVPPPDLTTQPQNAARTLSEAGGRADG